MKILFIEDDKFLRESLTQTMERYGYSVTNCNSAEEALELYRKEFHHIIITDVRLPGIDGLELCRRIRRLPQGRDSIILVETGVVEPANMNLVLDAGADDYITKPIDIDLLKIRLRIAETHYQHRYERSVAKRNSEMQKEHLEVLTEALHHMNLELLEKEKILLDLNSTKDKFCSILAHDIKNPLTSIVGFSQILSEYYGQLSEAERKEMITDIEKASQNLLNLIEDLLEWSRTQRGKIEHIPESISLYMMVYEEIALLLPTAETKNIRLECKIDETAKAFADKYMITTVIRNLISNAIKFTPKGGSVVISSENKGDFVEISVTDTGIGISEEDIPKLFRTDVRYTTFGTCNERGTGLGLLLCKEFVEKNGGKIWLKSKLGKGTTFYFTLPIG